MFKGQSHILEYVLMTLFIVIIITALIFFLTGWQFTQLRASESKSESDKALYLMKFMIKSPFFTRDESLFDDAKLSAFADMGQAGCKEMNVVFGRDWFARVYMISDQAGKKPCSTISDYGSCNSWSLCEQTGRKSFSYTLPVNIFRSSDNTNQLGVLEVGVYHD
jgi:hypothetical protein